MAIKSRLAEPTDYRALQTIDQHPALGYPLKAGHSMMSVT
jgi:hypothetical protein